MSTLSFAPLGGTGSGAVEGVMETSGLEPALLELLICEGSAQRVCFSWGDQGRLHGGGGKWEDES